MRYADRMMIGAVGAVNSTEESADVYAALSPYLNGITRTSDADVAAQKIEAAVIAAHTAAIADRAARAQPATPPKVPFANPAIVSARDSVLFGDSGLLIQSYGAVALTVAPLVLAPLFVQPMPPEIPPVPPVRAAAPVSDGVNGSVA
jgi:hypothetical protein